jgi:hypothetical protein
LGRQYGEQAREAVRQNVAFFVDRKWEPNQGRGLAAAVRRILSSRLPEVLDELDGLAEGSGVAPEKILWMNHLDTFGPEWREACTPMAIAAGPDGPLMGKNNDGGKPVPFDGQQGAYSYVIRRCRPARGIPFLQVTYAGWLSGLDAMNAEGLANGHASVGSAFNKTGPRVDIRLWLYRLMSTCKDTASLVAGLMDGSLTGKGFNIVVVDAAGDTAVVEAAVPLIQCRDRRSPFVFATNYFVTPPLKDADQRSPQAKQISTLRLGYLQWVAQTRLPTRLEDLKGILASHEPWAPCRHGGAHLSHTEWSMITLPLKREVLVAPAYPCVEPYQTFTVV